MLFCRIVHVIKNKNIKNSLGERGMLRIWLSFCSRFRIVWFLKIGFSPKASGFYPVGDATDLAGEGGVSAVAWLISSRGLNQPHHSTNAALPSEVGGIAKRIKTARLRRKTNLQKSDYPKTRTKREPNAKHSTLPQGCFLCSCFWFHWRFGNKA